ncbi:MULTISPECIES: hypothetical protein [unclassified Breznakia]|uniref:hypothetical protein n=1 Tax=unclassified Breznakia TaxID=2623764 RepID=UPI002406C9DE|nr:MULTISPECIES: hypothetical protein [unclassified Breznakia]MDF9837057.1 hypothetical protein [Breznakia sp. PFB2-8]MDF9858982.1 hypothetical protein [Breznakia sp. PH5-24]
MKKILIIVSMVTVLIGCGTNDDEKIKLKQDEFIVEFGMSYSYNKADYIKADKEILEKTKVTINGEDLDNPPVLDTTFEQWLEIYAVGEYEGVATYNNQTLRFTVKIEDTTPPEWFYFPAEIEIEKGSYDHVQMLFKATDYSGVRIVINNLSDESNKNDLDFANMEVGEYEIDVIAMDKYGNKISERSKVVVKE